MSDETAGADDSPAPRPDDAGVTRPLPVVRAEPGAPAAIDPQAPLPADLAPPVASEPPAPPPPVTTAPAPAPTPRPGPGRHAAPEADAGRLSRRWFLGGAGVIVLAAGGGIGAAFLHTEHASTPEPAPAALLAAIAAERTLLADLDATTGGGAGIRAVIAQVRADHAAHLTALLSLVPTTDPSAGRSPSPAAPSGTPRTAVQLRGAEQRAATQAAVHAAALDGRPAVLLASIAACEAGHAELLT